MEKLNRLEPFFFYTILALLLFPVWSLDFFVTSDGPCHLHNSKILLDWWQVVKRPVYDSFYYINPNFDPNWFYNLLTAPILALVGPAIAEKVFFTFYVLGFGIGFRFLIMEINPKSRFISSLGLLFCYHKLLMMGFFNNSLSMVIWFWVAAWWWRHRSDFRLGILIANALFFLVLYSAHPIGLTFGLMMIVSMILGLLLYESSVNGWKESRVWFEKRLKSFLISALPTLILFAEYIYRSNLSGVSQEHSVKRALWNVIRLSSLTTIDSKEQILAVTTAVLCILFFLGSILLRQKQKGLLPADGLLLFVGLVIFCIISPPNMIAGGLEVSFRMAIIPFIAILCWSATAKFPLWAVIAGQFSALVICIGFLIVRFPFLKASSDYASEIYTCDPNIKDGSTLFVLNYNWNGRTPDGKNITPESWQFTHIDCYLGVGKSLVISDNYEAHFPYFPIKVWWYTDMYALTDKDKINFDHRPPRADILSYYRKTKQNIDYVLMLSYSDEFKDHPYTIEIFDQLAEGYDKTFTSSNARAILYKRKDLVPELK